MAANPPVLSARELRLAVLDRQLLLERSALPLARALRRAGGLQSQYAPTMYIGLWSRLAGFARDDLTRALEARTVVQGTLHRVTIHLVAAADYWPTVIAIREQRRRWWLTAARPKPVEAEVVAAAERVRAALDSEGVLRAKDIDAIAGRDVAGGVGLWVDMVRVPPSGTWERRRADLYAAATDWLGPEPQMGRADAVDHLVRSYLTGFGPATPADAATWAGLPVADVTASLARLPTRRMRFEDGTELVDLARRTRPAPETDVPVRFLSTWEAVLLVHARRAEVIREDDRPRIFTTRKPHSANTFLVDGQVAGTWRFERGRVDIDPWRPLPGATARAVADEAGRLAAFHG